MLLTCDVCLACLALRFKGIKRLLETFLRGFSSVNRAPDNRSVVTWHSQFPSVSCGISGRRKVVLTIVSRLCAARFRRDYDTCVRHIDTRNPGQLPCESCPSKSGSDEYQVYCWPCSRWRFLDCWKSPSPFHQVGDEIAR